jgi:hypothetical protein
MPEVLCQKADLLKECSPERFRSVVQSVKYSDAYRTFIENVWAS